MPPGTRSGKDRAQWDYIQDLCEWNWHHRENLSRFGIRVPLVNFSEDKIYLWRRQVWLQYLVCLCFNDAAACARPLPAPPLAQLV